MSPEVFTERSPGEVVRTTGYERLIEAGIVKVRPVTGWSFVPSPLPADVSVGALLEGTSDVLTAVHGAIGELRGLSGDLRFARLFAAPLLQREAIISSKIENTIATASEVAEYRAGKRPRRDDAIEVDNYRKALLHGVNSELPLCWRLVCEMHRVLVSGVRGVRDHPGEIRRGQNRISGREDDFSSARFVPPPPGEHLDRCARDLELFWNRQPDKIDILLRAAMAHYQFEAIHPFEDGNGRIGRALVPVTLCKSGMLPEPLVYVSGYFDQNRQEYYDLLLRTSTHGDWIAWCRFFLTALVVVAKDCALRLKSVRALRQRTHETLAARNAPSNVLALVDALIEQPATTAALVAGALRVSNPTARNYIKRLSDIGFLDEITGGGYGQVWVATPLLKIIEADDPGDDEPIG